MGTYQRVFGNLKKKHVFGHAARNQAQQLSCKIIEKRVKIEMGVSKYTDEFYT